MRWSLERLGPLCGLLAAGVWLALFLTAMVLDPTWPIGGAWLSDLGVRQAAWAFNTACVLAGALILPYAMSIPTLLPKGRLTWLGTFLFTAAGVFLIGVGVFTEHFYPAHGVVSLGFFGSLILGWILLAYPMQRAPVFGGVGGLLNLGALGVVFGSAPIVNPYALEAIVVLTAVGWGMITAVVFLLRAPAAMPRPTAPAAKETPGNV
jgi:hypothetical membrane protein